MHSNAKSASNHIWNVIVRRRTRVGGMPSWWLARVARSLEVRSNLPCDLERPSHHPGIPEAAPFQDNKQSQKNKPPAPKYARRRDVPCDWSRSSEATLMLLGGQRTFPAWALEMFCRVPDTSAHSVQLYSDLALCKIVDSTVAVIIKRHLRQYVTGSDCSVTALVLG